MRLKSALDIATEQGLPHFRALQPEYNLVSRRKFEGELQDLCVTHNLGVLPYFGLAAGFLTGKYRTTDDFKKSVRGANMAKLLDGKGVSVLAAMDTVVAQTGATHAQVALAWLAAQPGVTAPIASATGIEQLEELTGAWTLDLDDDQLRMLSDAGI